MLLKVVMRPQLVRLQGGKAQILMVGQVSLDNTQLFREALKDAEEEEGALLDKDVKCFLHPGRPSGEVSPPAGNQ